MRRIFPLDPMRYARAVRRHGLPYLRMGLGHIGPWPRFLIIGAGKSGTNSMLDLIAQHPRVTPPLYKEPRYFNARYDRGERWYRAMFYKPGEARQEDVFSGEATVTYLSDPRVPERVRADCPDVRLIVLLRDPTARLISAYHFRRRNGSPMPPLRQWIEDSLRVAAAQAMQPRPMGDAATNAAHSKNAYVMLQYSLYARQLSHWFDFFPRDRFLILPSRAFESGYHATAARVYDFLGLDPFTAVEPHRLNVGTYPATDPDLVRQLDDFFAPSLDELEALVGFRP